MTDLTMNGKVCLITGAGSGIGRAAAIELARRGAYVVLVARNAERGAEAVQEVLAAAASPDDIHVEYADFRSLTQVRELAARADAYVRRLDVLINNAGLIIGERRVTEDGFEETFQVNHLAPFVLTTGLTGLLTRSAPARVVNVTSDAHRAAKIDFSDLQLERRYSGWTAYANSKLANIWFTRELARRLEGTGVTVNCVHPGTVATGFGREGSLPLRTGVRLFRRFFATAQEGARGLVHLASSPDVEGVTGGYYVKESRARPSVLAQDDAGAARLWEASERLVGQPA